MPEIGVAVSTHNRPQARARALAAWKRFLPRGARLVVVDDASDPPAERATFRFDEIAGVARTKNKGIELLDGCDHLFLVDDDCWPSSSGWWSPYVQSCEPHLMHCWGRKRRYLRTEGNITIWSRPRGAMLYAERRVIDCVGGMRVEFGRWGSEHVEWSMRIHNAGLTSNIFQDVVGSQHLWVALDKQAGHASTLSLEEKHRDVDHRMEVLRKYADSADYVPYM